MIAPNACSLGVPRPTNEQPHRQLYGISFSGLGVHQRVQVSGRSVDCEVDDLPDQDGRLCLRMKKCLGGRKPRRERRPENSWSSKSTVVLPTCNHMQWPLGEGLTSQPRAQSDGPCSHLRQILDIWRLPRFQHDRMSRSITVIFLRKRQPTVEALSLGR
jgi:hypothetical protein